MQQQQQQAQQVNDFALDHAPTLNVLGSLVRNVLDADNRSGSPNPAAIEHAAKWVAQTKHGFPLLQLYQEAGLTAALLACKLALALSEDLKNRDKTPEVAKWMRVIEQQHLIGVGVFEKMAAEVEQVNAAYSMSVNWTRQDEERCRSVFAGATGLVKYTLQQLYRSTKGFSKRCADLTFETQDQWPFFLVRGGN